MSEDGCRQEKCPESLVPTAVADDLRRQLAEAKAALTCAQNERDETRDLADEAARRLEEGALEEAKAVESNYASFRFVGGSTGIEQRSRRARLIGLDAEAAAVRAAQGLVRRVGYRNMEFCVTPIRAWRAPSRVDLVLSLHACDTATDEALALGVATGAQGIVAVPCCQHELAPQLRSNASDLAPLLAHPILRARLADWLADGLRALVLESHGYSVDVLEYISPLDTPKNILLRAELARDGADAAQRAAARAAEADTLMSRFGVRPSLPGLIEAMRASLKTWT